MIGETLHEVSAHTGTPGDTVMTAEALRVVDGQGVERLKSVGLAVRRGEIVAIAGVAGTDRTSSPPHLRA